MIKRGDLIVFEGPGEFFNNRSVWAVNSFIDDKSIAFYISDKLLYLVVDTFYIEDKMFVSNQKSRWLNIMEPYGRCGWWLDACFSLDKKKLTSVIVKKVSVC